MRILGIDPGIARMGWAVIETHPTFPKTIKFGCFETNSSQITADRLSAVFNFTKELITIYKPDTVGIEELFFQKNVKTALMVGEARGAIIVAVSLSATPLISYTPLQVKLALTGYGKADKNQIQQMVKSILNLEKIPKPDDAADALAIALTHSFSYKLQEKVQSL